MDTNITVEERQFSDGTKYYTAMAPKLTIRQGKMPPQPMLSRCTSVAFQQTNVATDCP